MDHAIIDREGRRAGRVDDIQLEIKPGQAQGERPELVLSAIVSGPLPRPTPKPFRLLARFCYRLCGVVDPQPALLDWKHVQAIDALVHVDVERVAAGLRAVDESVRRFIEVIPGSRRHER